MIALALLLAAQILPAPDSIPVWEPLPDDEEGRHFYDPASISRDGDVARVVYRSIFRELDEGDARSMMRRIQIHCTARTMGLEVADAYGEDGRLVESSQAEADTVAIEPIDPASTPPRFLRLAERVCGR
jgi:surface-adhesin protein E